jgi:hypothetical protein
MARKITFLSLLFLNVLYSNTLEVALNEVASIEQEKQKIAEIEELLKNATVPAQSLYPWLAEQTEVLKKSSSQDILELAQLLDSIQKNEHQKIQSRKVLSTFTNAVKVHNPNFSLGWAEGIKVLAAGTQWWRRS